MQHACLAKPELIWKARLGSCKATSLFALPPHDTSALLLPVIVTVQFFAGQADYSLLLQPNVKPIAHMLRSPYNIIVQSHILDRTIRMHNIHDPIITARSIALIVDEALTSYL